MNGAVATLVAAVLVLSACGGDGGGAADAGGPDAFPTDPLIEARPYDSNIPPSYDPATPTPLVVVLHGYTANGFVQATLFGMINASDTHGFLLAYPNGTVDSESSPFWNATDACCDRFGAGVDDVAYLTAVLDDMEGRFNVDPKRVYLVGHSNGGFMSHRLACELPGRIAGIVSLAGVVWADASRCPAGGPVNILQLHGTADDIVPYPGTSGPHSVLIAAIPSATQTVATWAVHNGCSGALTGDATLDLDTLLAGAETTVQAYAGCPAGGAVELWTIAGGSHIPSIEAMTYGETLWAWLEAHPKP